MAVMEVRHPMLSGVGAVDAQLYMPRASLELALVLLHASCFNGGHTITGQFTHFCARIALPSCCAAIICTTPSDVSGYAIASSVLDVPNFAISFTNNACAAGYSGTPAAAACTTAGAYALSGCTGRVYALVVILIAFVMVLVVVASVVIVVVVLAVVAVQ